MASGPQAMRRRIRCPPLARRLAPEIAHLTRRSNGTTPRTLDIALQPQRALGRALRPPDETDISFPHRPTNLGHDRDTPKIVRSSLSLAEVEETWRGFGDMVKACVDIGRGVMSLGGELHSDEQALLLDDGSRHSDIWGIDIYPAEAGDGWIEFDSMINVRPGQGKRSRGVDDPAIRSRILRLVESLLQRA
jgi:hypothetical protein